MRMSANRSSGNPSADRSGWPDHGDADWNIVSAGTRGCRHKPCPAGAFGLRSTRMHSGMGATPFFRFRSWTVSQGLALAPTFRPLVTELIASRALARVQIRASWAIGLTGWLITPLRKKSAAL